MFTFCISSVGTDLVGTKEISVVVFSLVGLPNKNSHFFGTLAWQVTDWASSASRMQIDNKSTVRDTIHCAGSITCVTGHLPPNFAFGDLGLPERRPRNGLVSVLVFLRHRSDSSQRSYPPGVGALTRC